MSSETIYLVTSGSYSNYRVDGAFATRELADEWVGTLTHHDHEAARVEEYPIETELPQAHFTWSAVVDISTDSFEMSEARTYASLHARCEVDALPKPGTHRFSFRNRDEARSYGHSTKEGAIKAAKDFAAQVAAEMAEGW